METDLLTLAQELAEIGRLVEDDDVETTLSRYVRRLVTAVPGCNEALLVVQADSSFDVVAGHRGSTADQSGDSLVAPATDAARAVLAEELVRTDGPMRDVLIHSEPHKIADTDTDERWPALATAMTAAGYRSCLMLPLAARSGPAAGFALLSVKPNAFAETTYDIVLLFALNAGVAFDNAQLLHDSRTLIDHLHTALETRTVIGQAEGLLMHRYNLSSANAFQVLKRGSQDNNIKLRQLAEDLVRAHHQGTLADALTTRGLAPTQHPL